MEVQVQHGWPCHWMGEYTVWQWLGTIIEWTMGRKRDCILQSLSRAHLNDPGTSLWLIRQHFSNVLPPSNSTTVGIDTLAYGPFRKASPHLNHNKALLFYVAITSLLWLFSHCYTPSCLKRVFWRWGLDVRQLLCNHYFGLYCIFPSTH